MGQAVYPSAIKVFTTYNDYSDVIWAHSINEIHDEVLSIEKILGTAPFSGTPYTSFSGAIHDLYLNKAPLTHTHDHAKLMDDTVGDDHPQYIKTDGSRGFTHPVSGQAGSSGSNLVTLAQVQAMDLAAIEDIERIASQYAAHAVIGVATGSPIWGTPNPTTWRLEGGLYSGCTDGDGKVTVTFSTPFPHCLQAFTCTKIPASGGGGCPNGPYNYIEAQITLFHGQLDLAIVQFSHDYSWQPGMHVSFTWMALGS